MKPYFIALGTLIFTGFICLLLVLSHGQLPLLFPSGSVGSAERDLMLHTVLLMLIVVVPVFILILFIAWHYRASNTGAKYTPNWEHSRMEELVWWSIPLEIVLVLAALTWSSTHQLDPAKALANPEPPYVVQVVALPWKWLFIYPQDGVASVNELDIPAGRPIEFQITADAPMNSFWIPALGGQEYAMTGMVTVLHLMANQPGTFMGRSSNYSGDGFAQMQFSVHALNAADFAAWATATRESADTLSPAAYTDLREPGAAGAVRYYGAVTMPFKDIVNAFQGMPMDSSVH